MPWLCSALVLGLACAAWWMRRRLLVVTVHGASMIPTYHDGDRVLARRRPHTKVRTGQVVVVDLIGLVTGTPPEAPAAGAVRRDGAVGWQDGGAPWLLATRVIKRVAAVAGEPTPAAVGSSARLAVPADTVVLLGDNPSRSTDSRHYGYVPAERVLAIVVCLLRR